MSNRTLGLIVAVIGVVASVIAIVVFVTGKDSAGEFAPSGLSSSSSLPDEAKVKLDEQLGYESEIVSAQRADFPENATQSLFGSQEVWCVEYSPPSVRALDGRLGSYALLGLRGSLWRVSAGTDEENVEFVFGVVGCDY